MLSRMRRLRSAEVNEVLAKGRPVRLPAAPGATQAGGRALSARILRTEKGGMRSAVVVPKSVAKTAVMRNRLRRAAYGALAELHSGTNGNMQIIFFVRSIPPPPLAPALRDEIGGILKNVLPASN